jgi:hypothetical protein
MSHQVYDGVVLASNLGPEFNKTADPIVLKLGAGLIKDPVTGLITVDPAFIAASVPPPTVDIYTNAATYAGGILTLKDNSAATPDIPVDLGDLKKVVTAPSPSVTFSGTGETATPLTATVIAIPAGVPIPAGQIAGTVPPGVMTSSTAHINAWTKAAGLTESVNGVASNVPIPSDVLVDILGYNAAGAPAWQSKTALAATLSIAASQITGQTVSNTIAGVGAARTISTTVNGVVGAPVPLPETVIPATTVSNTVAGAGLTRTISTTVNGVVGVPVPLPDADGQTLTLGTATVPNPAVIGGSYTAQPTIAISNGNTITLPSPDLFARYNPTALTATSLDIRAGSGATAASIPVYTATGVLGLVPAPPSAPLVGKFLQADGTWAAPIIPATTHTNTWTKAGGLKQTVNGIASDTAIPVGVIADTIGYDAAGNPVSQALGIQPDFFSSITAAADTLASPNGVTDRTEKIRRDGFVGLTVDPLTTLDNGGSHSDGITIVTTNAATPYVVLPTDSTLSMNGSTDQAITFPDAAAFTRRILTVRLEWQLTNARVTINTPTAQLEHINGFRYSKITLDNRAVASVTYQSNGTQWRLIDWTARAFYSTQGYSLSPANALTTTSFIGTGLPAAAAGVPIQVPAGITDYQVVDGNYQPLIALPATNNATGRFSVWVNNSGGFDTTIASTNTDLPQDTLIPSGQGRSMHFEWSNGLWRWVYAPEKTEVVKAYSYIDPNPSPAVWTTILTNTPVNSATIAQGVTNFDVNNAAYAALITLPPVTPTSVPVTIRRSSAFGVAVAATNTDLQRNLDLTDFGQVVRFYPGGDGKWHWIDPEINILQSKFRGRSIVAAGSATIAYTQAGQVWTIDRLVKCTSAGVITLTTPPAAISGEMVDYEMRIKTVGNWAGTTVITPAAGVLIEGLATYTINKVAGLQPSITVVWDGSAWFVV